MVTVKINTIDRTDHIEQKSLTVIQRLTSQVDTASFNIKKAGDKTLTPAYNDDVEVYDGATKIFGGKIIQVEEAPLSGGGGVIYSVSCSDHTYEIDKQLASKTYEGETIADIIADLVSSYAPTFTSTNATSTIEIERITFNQIPISSCLKKLADIVQYDWYIDANKDVHFFAKEMETAPFNLTDTNGNYVYKTLKRTSDGSQITNRVKLRGGEYEGTTYTDSITVSGNDTTSFTLPYKFSNLTVSLNGTPLDVGQDFIDDFTSKDVLQNYQEKIIKFETALSDADVIEFSGNPKVPVFAISEDSTSIALYGVVEKLIRDTSITSNAIARKRASAELYAYSAPVIDAKFYTYQAGLSVGMTIAVQSTLRGIDDRLIIKTLTFKVIDSENFGYQVELISTKRQDFIDLLQKLMAPDASDAKDSEVSESIFTDTKEVKIAEEISVVLPVEGDEDMEIAENYILDPFGAGVNATYVLAPYSPTSQTDTKRPGKLDNSFEVY